MTSASCMAPRAPAPTGLVGLTFDDGPDPVWTTDILRALAEVDVRATFFVISRRAAVHQRALAAIIEAGHEIGLHCARHLRHTETPRAMIERDTDDALQALSRLGVRPTRWRVPWGACAGWTECLAGAHGLSLVGWTADTHDWRGDPARAMLRAISPRLVGGAVVLMHDGIGPGARRDDSLETVRLIEPLVAAIRERGLDAGSLADLEAAALGAVDARFPPVALRGGPA
jgi:peptidoglycan/xylan/chitin deacetylase (PgdA/CDA1 family)